LKRIIQVSLEETAKLGCEERLELAEETVISRCAFMHISLLPYPEIFEAENRRGNGEANFGPALQVEKPGIWSQDSAQGELRVDQRGTATTQATAAFCQVPEWI
jgi:hypothetical protein